jgi:glutathione S-transferase
MKLYYFETPNARKACTVARYLNAPVEFVRVDLSKGEHKAPAYLAINPNGKVPALEDGDVRLWESAAIMCYLADKAGSSLWPKDARQIDVIRWLSWDATHFSRHAGTLFFQRVIKPQFGLGEPDPAAIEEATGFFRQFAGVLDGHLKGRAYLVGDGLTVADFAVGSFLPGAKAAQLPLDEFPEVRRWYAQLEQLPAWREPFPSQTANAA